MIDRPGNSPDFRSVYWPWPPHDFSFTRSQAAAVQVLWGLWLRRTPEIGDAELRSLAGVNVSMATLFRYSSRQGRKRKMLRHKALGVMLIPGRTKGTWRLPGIAPAELVAGSPGWPSPRD